MNQYEAWSLADAIEANTAALEEFYPPGLIACIIEILRDHALHLASTPIETIAAEINKHLPDVAEPPAPDMPLFEVFEREEINHTREINRLDQEAQRRRQET